ncbi:hypothetical protein BU197_08235, partial [Streptomyces sp. CBMA291]
MRHRPGTGTDSEGAAEGDDAKGGNGDSGGKGGKKDGKRIELSVAQVSGSAVAAVIAAKLASTLGVYGTIVGAGLISVIATCGGPVFQHLFRRTGEQMRDVTTAAKPKARQVPVPVPAAPRDDHTLMLGTVQAPAPYDEEFGTATTHGTRMRGWKRPAVAAALVFGVAMGGITAYELIADEDFSGRQGTTTFGSVVRGGEGKGQQDAPAGENDPTPGPSETGDGSGTGTPAPGGTTAPDGGTATATLAPRPTPSGEGTLDEEATAERSAASGILIPVLRPAAGRRPDIQ